MGVLQTYDAQSFDLLLEDGRTITIKRKEAALVKPYIRF